MVEWPDISIGTSTESGSLLRQQKGVFLVFPFSFFLSQSISNQIYRLVVQGTLFANIKLVMDFYDRWLVKRPSDGNFVGASC